MSCVSVFIDVILNFLEVAEYFFLIGTAAATISSRLSISRHFALLTYLAS
jgi:hypothetical protein